MSYLRRKEGASGTLIAAIAVVVILVVGGLYFSSQRQSSSAPGDLAMEKGEGAMMEKEGKGAMMEKGEGMMEKGAGAMMGSETYTIEITAQGFTPSALTIKKGDTVKFVNKDTREHWPASALHPTHRVYPGSDIAKCGTSEAATIFDACRGLKMGEMFQFTFNAAGQWGFHDHLNVSMFGRITVEEGGAMMEKPQ